jgi:uncharacterized protein YdiU (UPF0061 family)
MNVAALPSGLARLEFDNRFVRALPSDPLTANERRQVRGAMYSRVLPLPAPEPTLLAVSREVAGELGLQEPDWQSPEFAEVFAGNRLLPGMDPHATCYGGHQFGNWAGQLGDGRAINLGEALTPEGARQTLQLKGAGPTPYSRTADGFAVLRSSLREFVCSEAMHHLGVPTTRALSLIATGRPVVRDMLYDGNPAPEPGAVVCRVAPSFTRFGHFELLAARQETDLLARLLEHTVKSDFPSLLDGVDAKDLAALASDWFGEVCERTAALMVHWMRVGFVHGVMNTDNMSVLGLTIDYGPYGWLEDYDPDWTPNTTDAVGRRYRYGQQPAVAQWNLLQLANAIYPLVGEAAPLEAALRGFEESYTRNWRAMMAAKLGLETFEPASDVDLIDDLDVVLRAAETDVTLFYRRLAEVPAAEPEAGDDPLGLLADAYYAPDALAGEAGDAVRAWLVRYRRRLARDRRDDAVRRGAMNAVNPLYVPRNYLAQLAIDRMEAGDAGYLSDWLEVLRRPYDAQPGAEAFAGKRPEWARSRVGCSQLSCSS